MRIGDLMRNVNITIYMNVNNYVLLVEITSRTKSPNQTMLLGTKSLFCNQCLSLQSRDDITPA